MDTKPKERRLSYTSISLMTGSFPEDVSTDIPTISVLMTFQNNPPSIDNLTDVVKTFLLYKRLHSIPVLVNEEISLKDWKYSRLNRDIDPREMIRVVDIDCDTVEQSANMAQQQRSISLRTRGLPWWEFVIMNNRGKGDHILLFRIDHGVADGLSIGKLFSSIIKKSDGSAIDSLVPSSMFSNKRISWSNLFSMLMKFPKAYLDVSTAPMSREDDPTCFSKKMVGLDRVDKRSQGLVVFPTVPIDFIKKVKDKTEASFNDVLLALWTQTVEDYCNLHKCPILKSKGKKLLFRVSMYYGFPQKEKDYENAIGNRWVPLPIRLPLVSEKTLTDKLKRINSNSNYMKSSPLPLLQYALQNMVLPLLPLFLARSIVQKVYSKISLSLTNVPGPQEKVSIAGETVDSCMFFLNTVHPVLSCLSYDKHVHMVLSIEKDDLEDSHILPNIFMRTIIAMGNELKIEVPKEILKHS